MSAVNKVFGALLDALLAPLELLGLGPFGACLVISLLMGVLFLWIFKITTNQEKIQEATRRLFAHLIETRLFNHEPGVVLRSMGQLMRWNWRYFILSLRPAFVLMVPTVLLLTQMEAAWGVRPLRVGESTTVTAKIEDYKADGPSIKLSASEGVVVETPSARSRATGEASWRVRAVDEGPATLTVHVGDASIDKTVHVGPDGGYRISTLRSSDLYDQLLYPVEDGLPGGGGLLSVSVAYPTTTLRWGLELHWIYWLLFWSIAPAFLLRWIVNSFRPNTL